MRTLICGFYNNSNIGDEAFRLAYPLLLPDYEIEFRDHVRGDDSHDFFILGGGDIARSGFTKNFTIEQNKRTTAASISVTDTSDFDFLRKCRRVIVRDSSSVTRCEEQGVWAESLPDFAFLLRADAERGREWILEKFRVERKQLYRRVICCVPNAYTFTGGHDVSASFAFKAGTVADDLAWVFDRLDASVLFLPFGTQPPADDRVASGFVNSRCKWYGKHVVAYDRLDVQTTLDVIAACDTLVGNRLHSLIFATITGIPFVALDHYRKIADFVVEVGRPDWSMKFADCSRDWILETLRRHLDVGCGDELRDYAEQARSSILAASFP